MVAGTSEIITRDHVGAGGSVSGDISKIVWCDYTNPDISGRWVSTTNKVQKL
jgi:hypothetical protein